MTAPTTAKEANASQSFLFMTNLSDWVRIRCVLTSRRMWSAAGCFSPATHHDPRATNPGNRCVCRIAWVGAEGEPRDSLVAWCGGVFVVVRSRLGFGFPAWVVGPALAGWVFRPVQ